MHLSDFERVFGLKLQDAIDKAAEIIVERETTQDRFATGLFPEKPDEYDPEDDLGYGKRGEDE